MILEMDDECEEHIYIIAKSACGPSKIGISRNPLARKRELQCGNPHRLKLVYSWVVPDRDSAIAIERHILQFYAKERLAGTEWLNIDSFSLSRDVQSCVETVYWRLATNYDFAFDKTYFPSEKESNLCYLCKS